MTSFESGLGQRYALSALAVATWILLFMKILAYGVLRDVYLRCR